MNIIPMPLTERITRNSRKSVKDRVIEVSFGDGYRQIAEDGINSQISSWQLQFSPLNGVQLTELLTFLNNVKTSNYIEWTPFGETIPKLFRRNKDSLKETMLSTDTYLIEFSITEDFEIITPFKLQDSSGEYIFDSIGSYIYTIG